MRIKRRENHASLLLLTCVLFLSFDLSFAQEPEKFSGPGTEFLTMNGGKPILSATGEGMTSYKNDEIYQLGTMKVRLLKREEVNFKVELPIGYTLYNDLIYKIETDIVFAGWSDITFSLPSARTKETFAQLRILYPRLDWAEPKVPRWIDITLDRESADAQESLTEAAIKKRVPDFKSKLLHAFTQDTPPFFLVALRDPAKVRNKLRADLEITGTGPEQVTEGGSVTYEVKIRNNGPDTATGITLQAPPTFSLVSVKATEGKCNMFAQNVACNIPSLAKGATVAVKIVEQCEWGSHTRNSPSEEEGSNPSAVKHFTVRSTEQDPEFENNQLDLTTEIYPDQNKGPVIEFLSPTLLQNFPGPAATVPIRFKASDPDGFIKKVELFDLANGKALGEATLRSEGEYELIYKDVDFGIQVIQVVATDNLGRVASENTPQFFVNGLAKVEIMSPKAETILNRTDGEITITIHASHPSSRLKKVGLDIWERDATPIGNDQYVVKLDNCARKCRLRATAIDDKGLATVSEFVEFTFASAPTADLSWFDGEYLHRFEPGKALKAIELALVPSADYENDFYAAKLARIDIFIDGVLYCTDKAPMVPNSDFECIWRPAPGKYKLHAVATDVDGMVGKTEVIEVVIERP
jgi:uncharacterized repeat protein (TIGR01451 family)